MYLSKNLRSILRARSRNFQVVRSSKTATESVLVEKPSDEATKTIEKSEIILEEDKSLTKRDHSDLLINADPFEDIPGPQVLKKLSTVFKYMPAVGSQTTVSILLSVFQMASVLAGFGRTQSRPFGALFRKYGPIVKLQGPLGTEVVLLNRPEHIAAVYEQEGRFPVRSTLDSVEKCRSQTKKGTGGLYNLSGTEWEEVRKALQEPLSKGGEKYFGAIEEASGAMVKRVRAIRNRQNETPGDFMIDINRWSLECLCHVTLDKSLGFFQTDDVFLGSEAARLLKSVCDATESICKCEGGFQVWRLIETPSAATLTQACEAIDSIVSRHIRQAQMNLTKKKNERNVTDLSLIERMLLDECMTPEEVMTTILDVLLIGMNTTSSALGFLLYHLAQNQRAQRVLFKEIKQVLPEKDSKLEYRQLHSLKYLQACLKESLRLKMPMPLLTRILPCDIVISSFRIPKGTYMVMDAQIACLKEHNFEKAERFAPERWLEPIDVDPMACLPFGRGPRSCVGKRLAEVQLWACAAKIVRNFLVEYNYGELKSNHRVLSLPDKPLRLTFADREE